MKIFKNYKSRKQLKNEIKTLKSNLDCFTKSKNIFKTTEKKVIPIKCQIRIDGYYSDNEIRSIIYKLMEEDLKKYIKFITTELPINTEYETTGMNEIVIGTLEVLEGED